MVDGPELQHVEPRERCFRILQDRTQHQPAGVAPVSENASLGRK
jgi:hypothetical protein